MTLSTRRCAQIPAFAALSLAALAATGAQAQTLPPNPDPTACSVTPSEFKGWFASGSVAPNGLVKPADSTQFPSQNNCDFYKWSAQMFLWLTSPPPSGKSHWVFDTPLFYAVSPSVNGVRTLTQQGMGAQVTAGVRDAQAGPHGLPVVIDAQGRLREVVRSPVAKDGNSLVQGPGGKPVEVGQITKGTGGKANFLDLKNNAIKATPQVQLNMLPGAALKRMGNGAAAQNALANVLKAEHGVEEFKNAKGQSAFVDLADGTVVDLGNGQAGDSGVLLAQNGSLVYYQTLVNDVFAYYLTGRKDGCIPPAWDPSQPDTGQFPTTATDLAGIKVMNTSNQCAAVTLPAGDALAMELKLSWVEARNLPDDSSTYIQRDIRVPKYNRVSDTLWQLVPNASEIKHLALTGFHVVGSAQHDPEMIWATFEHDRNAPMNTYKYIVPGRTIVTVPRDTSGNWLLAKAPYSDDTWNVEHAQFCTKGSTYPSGCSGTSSYIMGTPNNTITPSNTLIVRSWGADLMHDPGPDTTPELSNTQVIALDTSVIKQLLGDDVRKNYIMTGAVWTKGGVAPTYSFSIPPFGTGNVIGTSQLINSTLETYQQTNTKGDTGPEIYATDCMACHSAADGQTQATTVVSHIFSSIAPLPPVNGTQAAKPKAKPKKK